MSISESALIASLKNSIPQQILVELLNEYKHIKQQFFLGDFRPAELTGARFAECVLRLLEHVHTGSSTPFGTTPNSEKIVNSISNNAALSDTVRFFIPRLTRIILDVRNRRNVAHVGGEVDPNYSDSLFVVHSADWILTEIVREYHSCSIEQAASIVSAINETKIPIVDNIDGFVRVLDTSLGADKKALVILYSYKPDKVSEQNLRSWIEYKNPTNFRNLVLKPLHKQALIHIHSESGACTLTKKGVLYVEANISLSYPLKSKI